MIFVGFVVFLIIFVLIGLVFILFVVIICFRNWIFGLKNEYFFVFIFKFILFSWLNIFLRLEICFLKFFLNIIMLFRYSIVIFYCNLFKVFFIICWNVVGVLYKLNGIMVYWNKFFLGVVKVVFFLFCFVIGIWWYVIFKFSVVNYLDLVRVFKLFFILGMG